MSSVSMSSRRSGALRHSGEAREHGADVGFLPEGCVLKLVYHGRSDIHISLRISFAYESRQSLNYPDVR